MSDFVLRRADVRSLVWHLALYGLAAILEETGTADIRLSWTRGMQPRALLTADALTADLVDDAVRQHARDRAAEPSWLLADVELRGKLRGLMSPRLTPFDGPEVWRDVQTKRHAEIDQLTAAHAWLDLRQIAALGEPCYWSRNRQDEVLQDDGASRLEMQPRNQGSEFVGSRLRKLAQTVGARQSGTAASGLEGLTTVDEAGDDRVDSRTATGLTNPGPTDNAVAWCALWGISQLPVSPRINGTAVTTGHLGRSRNEWFYAPVWESPWRPARLRTILASQPPRDAAGIGLPGQWGTDAARGLAAQGWLAARGVVGLVRFPIMRFGSDSAPERRAMLGVALPLASS